MKLLTCTTLYFVSITLLVFSLGGFIFYHSLRTITSGDADERLNDEKAKVLNYVKVSRKIPYNAIAFGDTMTYKEIASSFSSEMLKDTMLYNSSEKESEPYRMIEFPISNGEKTYRAIIFKPLIESDDLTEGIFQSLAIIAAILLGVLIVLNFFVSKAAWKPFYKSLEKLKSFDVTKHEGVAFDATTITEFKAMNKAIEDMTARISTDYKSLKEFTENASHEIQTPLAIIQSKLELLIQSETLSKEQMNNVQAVYESASRLSKLNQALLLLTKIENRQFAEVTDVALNQVIENKLELFKEWVEHRKISVEKHITPFIVKVNPALADILITNLISNSIKHNIDGGKLNMKLMDNQLVIENLGAINFGSSDDLFTRFKKADQSSDSLGLGLAIVKEICNAYGFRIHYENVENLHRITLDF